MSNNTDIPTHAPSQTVRVWDLPTRVFHWALFLAIVSAFVTAKIGGNAMVWHMRIGYFITTLLLWRLVWGLVGGHYSRFLNFIYSPATVLAYLKGKAKAVAGVGHNPLGAGSVFALLGVLLIQAATGWISDDEIAVTGPLAKFVSTATSLNATGWHKHYGEILICVLVALHVAAIVFYLKAKKENLIKPMLHGDKVLHTAEVLPGSVDNTASRITALVIWLAVAVGVFGTAWKFA